MEVVLTSHRHGGRELLKQLRGLGRFRRTGFRDVIKGNVDDLEGFLRELERRNVLSLSRVIPIERHFTFSPDNVVKEFCDAAKPLIGRIGKGESFCIVVERRGLKGFFSSHEVAKEVGTFIFKTLWERDGEKPRVDLNDPDKAIVFETLDKWCGVGVVSKEIREKYFYLRLP